MWKTIQSIQLTSIEKMLKELCKGVILFSLKKQNLRLSSTIVSMKLAFSRFLNKQQRQELALSWKVKQLKSLKYSTELFENLLLVNQLSVRRVGRSISMLYKTKTKLAMKKQRKKSLQLKKVLKSKYNSLPQKMTRVTNSLLNANGKMDVSCCSIRHTNRWRLDLVK